MQEKEEGKAVRTQSEAWQQDWGNQWCDQITVLGSSFQKPGNGSIRTIWWVQFSTQSYYLVFLPELLIQKRGSEKVPVIELHHRYNSNSSLTKWLTGRCPVTFLFQEPSREQNLNLMQPQRFLEFTKVFMIHSGFFSLNTQTHSHTLVTHPDSRVKPPKPSPWFPLKMLQG